MYILFQVEYYKQKKEEDFVRILEASRTDANTMYRDSEKDQVTIALRAFEYSYVYMFLCWI